MKQSKKWLGFFTILVLGGGVLAVMLVALLSPAKAFPTTEGGDGSIPISEEKYAYLHDVEVASLDNVYIPTALREEGLGIFFLAAEGENEVSYHKSTTQAAKTLFDPQKPTMIFFHGMQGGSGATREENFREGLHFVRAGYNTAIFYWSQFADAAAPDALIEKLWGVDGYFPMEWRKTNGKAETVDVPDVSVAELFAAYYLDFMAEFPNYNGQEIRLTGLSMGGPLVIAATSYLQTMAAAGKIDKRLVPDRVALFDPYFSGADNLRVNITWLNNKMNAPSESPNGNPNQRRNSLEFCVDVLEQITGYGILIEYIPSSTGSIPVPYVGSLAAGYDRWVLALTRLKALSTTLHMETAYNNSDFSTYHLAGRGWYMESVMWDAIPKDHAFYEVQTAGYSAKTALSQLLARQGGEYEMEKNRTAAHGDETMKSINLQASVVTGFVFLDSNQDGLYNERLAARKSGVKVELLATSGGKTEVIQSVITDQKGYYRFLVGSEYQNKTLVVRTKVPNGYQITHLPTAVPSALVGMENGVQANGYTAPFTLVGAGDGKIINVGLTK